MKKFFLFFVLFAPVSVFAQQLGGYNVGSMSSSELKSVGGFVKAEYSQINRSVYPIFGEQMFSAGLLVGKKNAFLASTGNYVQAERFFKKETDDCGCSRTEKNTEVVIKAPHVEVGWAHQTKSRAFFATLGVAYFEKRIFMGEDSPPIMSSWDWAATSFAGTQFKFGKGKKNLFAADVRWFVPVTDIQKFKFNYFGAFGKIDMSVLFPVLDSKRIFFGGEAGFLRHHLSGNEYIITGKSVVGWGKGFPIQLGVSLGPIVNMYDGIGLYSNFSISWSRFNKATFKPSK